MTRLLQRRKNLIRCANRQRQVTVFIEACHQLAPSLFRGGFCLPDLQGEYVEPLGFDRIFYESCGEEPKILL